MENTIFFESDSFRAVNGISQYHFADTSDDVFIHIDDVLPTIKTLTQCIKSLFKSKYYGYYPSSDTSFIFINTSY